MSYPRRRMPLISDSRTWRECEGEKGRRRLPAWATGWGREACGAEWLADCVSGWTNEWVSEWVSDVCYLTDVGVDNISLSVHVYMSSCVCEWVCVEKSSSRSRRQLDQSKQSPWKTSECNFQSIVVAALQQHTPAHKHTRTYTHAGILNFC